jgi:hypothetical protein
VNVTKREKQTMSKKYTISYQKPSEVTNFVITIKAKTAEEARAKFEKQYPNWTITAINEA